MIKNDVEPGEFALEEFLPYRLSLLSNTVSQGISAAYRKAYGLSVTEWRVVAILGRFPGITASQVMARAAMDKVSVSRAVGKLLDKALVERSAHNEDRRRMLLRLTPRQGRPLFDAVVPRAQAYERELLASLDASEQASLGRLLNKLQQAAETLNQSGD